MKKQIIKLMSASLFVFIFSCNNENLEQFDDALLNQMENKISSTDEYQRLYEKILLIDDLNEQKITLSSFSFDTQSILWQLKLNNFIKHNNLTNKQLKIINELKNLLTPDNLRGIRNKNNTTLTQKTKMLKTKIINSFEKNIGWYLINKFENINQTLAKIDLNTVKQTDPNNNTIGDCNCTKNSDCIRLTGISMYGLSWEYGTCQPQTCYSSDGWFGLFENDNNRVCEY
jgi:hypothetical protein